MVALASFLLILLPSVAAFGYSLAGWLAVWAALRTRPVTYLSFWTDFHLGGESPLGYHAVNLVLHAAGSILLWKVLGRLVPARAALDPGSPLALSNRGAALAALHHDGAARLDFERALKLDPCLTGARENLRRLGVASETPASCPAAP